MLALGDWPTPKTPLAGAGGPPARWAAPRPLVLEVNYDGAVPPAVPRLDRLNALPAARAWDRRNPDEPYSPPDLVADEPPVFRSVSDVEGRLLVTTS